MPGTDCCTAPVAASSAGSSGGTIPAAIAADWLTSVWDQNAGAYACAPSASIIEEVVGGWLKEILGLPQQASYAFVTGCQMAHVTALAAARHKILADKGWSVEEQGLAGGPPIRVLVGEHHETLRRAVRHLGIGTDAIVQVALTDDGTIDVAALRVELERDLEAPTIVSLAAGDLNRGAFDPFDEVCCLAHDYKGHRAWVHIDGIEKADSWATDGHKWLNVPYDSGIAFVADADSHRASMTKPIINQGLVRFLDPSGDHDARTVEIIEAIKRPSIRLVRLGLEQPCGRGMHVMRISLSNFRTIQADINRVVTAVRQALQAPSVKSA